MENPNTNLETGFDSAEIAPESIGLIEQIKETLSGIKNLFKLKIKKLLKTVFDFKRALQKFQIEVIEFGMGMRTVVAYDEGGIDYPEINNFLTKEL